MAVADLNPLHRRSSNFMGVSHETGAKVRPLWLQADVQFEPQQIIVSELKDYHWGWRDQPQQSLITKYFKQNVVWVITASQWSLFFYLYYGHWQIWLWQEDVYDLDEADQRDVMWRCVYVQQCLRLCLCSPDLYVAVLLTPIPVRPVCDSMWHSQCVDVFRKREETHLAPHTHCSAKTAKRSWLLLVWALQKSSTLMSTNSQLMVFIPLAMLDTLPLSPQPKHIMGWVSFYLDIYLIYLFIHSFHHTLFFIFIQWGSRSLIIHQLFFFFILSFSFLSLPGFPWFPLSGSGSSSVIRDGPRARVARRVL